MTAEIRYEEKELELRLEPYPILGRSHQFL